MDCKFDRIFEVNMQNQTFTISMKLTARWYDFDKKLKEAYEEVKEAGKDGLEIGDRCAQQPATSILYHLHPVAATVVHKF